MERLLSGINFLVYKRVQVGIFFRVMSFKSQISLGLGAGIRTGGDGSFRPAYKALSV